MPQTTGLDRPTKSRNNPNGDLINIGVMVDKDAYKAFDSICKKRCVTKAAAVRAFISHFAETGRLPGID